MYIDVLLLQLKTYQVLVKLRTTLLCNIITKTPCILYIPIRRSVGFVSKSTIAEHTHAQNMLYLFVRYSQSYVLSLSSQNATPQQSSCLPNKRINKQYSISVTEVQIHKSLSSFTEVERGHYSILLLGRQCF